MYRATVLAQQLASDNGIDLSLVGTHPDEEITETHVLNYLTRVMSGEAEPPSEPVDQPPPDWDGQMPSMPLEALKSAGIESEITAFVEQRVAQPPRRDDVRPPAPARPSGGAVNTLTIPTVTPSPVTPSPAPVQTAPQFMERPVAAAPSPVAAAPLPSSPAPTASGPGSAAAPGPVPPAPVTPPPVQAPPAAAPRSVLGNLTSLLTSMYKKEPAPTTDAPQAVPAPQPAAEARVITPPVPAVTSGEVPAPDVSLPAAPQVDPTPADPTSGPLLSPPPAHVAAPLEETPEPLPAVSAEPELQEVLAPAPAAEVPAPPVVPVPDLIEPVRAPLLLSPRSTVTVRVTADAERFTAVYTQLCEALGQDVDVADLVTLSAERHTQRLLGGLVIGTVRHDVLTGLPRTGTVRERLTGAKRTLDDADLLIVNTSRGSAEEIVYHDRPSVCVHHDPAQGRLHVSVHGERDVAQALARALADDLSLPMRLLV